MVGWLLRALAFGFTSLIGALLGVYLARINIARHFTEKAFSQSNITEYRFDWDRLDSTNSSMSNVFIRSESYSLSVDTIDLNYDLKEAWTQRTLKNLKLEGVRLKYDLRGPSTVDLQEIDSMIRKGIPFPLHSAIIENATIGLLTERGEKNFNLELVVNQDGPSSLLGTLNLATETESLALDIKISDRIRLSAQANLEDMGKSLATNGIDLQKALPNSQSIDLALSSAEVMANATFNGLSLESAIVSTETGSIGLRGVGWEVAVDRIQTSIELKGSQFQNGEAVVSLQKIESELLNVSDFNIQLSAPRPNEVQVTVPRAKWETNNGEKGLLSARVNSVLKDDYAIDHYSGSVSFLEFYGDTFKLSPFDLDFRGNLDAASLDCDELVNQRAPSAVIQNLQAAIEGLRSDNPVINLSARIVSDEKSNLEKTPTVSGIWDVKASLLPATSPRKATFTLNSIPTEPIARYADTALAGTATLEGKIEYWPDSREAALELKLTGDNLETTFNDWSLQGGAASIGITIEPVELIPLMDWRTDPSALVDFVAPLARYQADLQGSRISGPSNTSIQWFSGSIRSAEDRALLSKDTPIRTRAEFNAGIFQAGQETFTQISLDSAIAGSTRKMDGETKASLLFENEPVSIHMIQSIENRDTEFTANGRYKIEGINLVSSDALARHLPELKGSSVSALIGLQGQTHWVGQTWDATAEIQIEEGSFQFPSKELFVESISADIHFPSLVKLITDPSQTIRAERVAIGDIEATGLETVFTLKEGNLISIDKTGFTLFDGAVSVDPFVVSLERPNTDLLVRFHRISVTPAIAMLDFFNGQVSGRLNGSLPIRIKNGYPVLGEGFLELDPSESAQFSYNAKGYFTNTGNQSRIKKSLGDKLLVHLGLEPNALLEEALGNLKIHQLRLDLFNKDLPETPMRIQLAGVANTGKTQIPLNITTNVNGTVAELLNFLMRLDSLGLVASQTPDE